MDDTSEYLVDESVLGQFIDELIKRKPLAVSSVEELVDFRKKSMRELNNRFIETLFNRLSDAQREELSQILSSDTGGAEPYQEFFVRNGINLEQLFTKATEQYAQEFLGGQHA